MTTTQVYPARIQPAPYIGSKSLLANGSFSIWQRGPGPFDHSGAAFRRPGPDEWEGEGYTPDGFTTQRSTDAKIGTYSCLCSFTDAGTNSGRLEQGIDSYKALEGQYVTFSAWVKCNAVDAVRLRIMDYDGAVQKAFSGYHTGDSTWQLLTATKLVRTGLIPNVGGMPHDFGLSVAVIFDETVAGAVVDGATFVPGYYPEGLPFVPLNRSEDLDRVQRYYEIVDPTTPPAWLGMYIAPIAGGWYTADDKFSAGYYFGTMRFQTRKESVPTITISGYTEPPGETSTVFTDVGAGHDEWKFSMYDNPGTGRANLYLRSYFKMEAEVL